MCVRVYETEGVGWREGETDSVFSLKRIGTLQYYVIMYEVWIYFFSVTSFFLFSSSLPLP